MDNREHLGICGEERVFESQSGSKNGEKSNNCNNIVCIGISNDKYDVYTQADTKTLGIGRRGGLEMFFVFLDGGTQLGNCSNLDSNQEEVYLSEVRGLNKVILVNVVSQ
jgi:hypothetical protein